MQLYAIRRRNGWNSPEALQEAAARSKRVGDEEMPSDVRWIRSYIVDEGNGQLGTVCIYEAASPEAIRTTPTAPICLRTRSRPWWTRS